MSHHYGNASFDDQKHVSYFDLIETKNENYENRLTYQTKNDGYFHVGYCFLVTKKGWRTDANGRASFNLSQWFEANPFEQDRGANELHENQLYENRLLILMMSEFEASHDDDVVLRDDFVYSQKQTDFKN